MIFTANLLPVALGYPFLRLKEYLQALCTVSHTIDLDDIYEEGVGAQLILENAETAYILIDPQLQVVTFNQVAEKFTISTFQKKLQKRTYSLDYFPHERREVIRGLFTEALAGVDSEYEVQYPDSDGSLLWYAVNIRGVKKNSRLVGTIMSVRNITEKRNMELQRKEMTGDLLQHNRNLEQFSYIVSHNLRAPLANIIGLSDVLVMPGVDDVQKNEFLRHISFASQKLDEVIVDLNTILHLRNHNDEQKQPLTFCGVLEEVKLALKDTIPGLRIHISSDFSQADQITSIKSYLYSIFYNLVSNSIKYRQHGIELMITIHSRVVDGKLELSFKDNGTGIDMKRNKEKIFGLYNRFHPHVEGKGMGLYMTRIQVEKLGGNISVESVLNEGTEFKIQFI